MNGARLLQEVKLGEHRKLAEYEAVAHLAAGVHELRESAAAVLPRLTGRTVWMVSSTSQGGGVAEMLQTIVSLLRDLGVQAEWRVIGSTEPAFFALTKRIHNLIHGTGDTHLDAGDRELYERVNRENAQELLKLIHAQDILIVHDPQPLPMAGLLRESTPLLTIWRSHIGLEIENAATRAVWDFLAPYLSAYDHAVFSAPEYIPRELADRATVIHPGIDPLAPKNRELSLRGAVEILCNGGLVVCPGPTVDPPYTAVARRALADGSFAPANARADIGLLTRPIVTQVSRWDRLKGFLPLMQAFVELKSAINDDVAADGPAHRRQLALARLVLAGPEPESIQDDPEGREVVAELCEAYATLDPALQDDIAIIALPMRSLEQNALLVNALQRASTLVVQNSLREGFGLTIAEAMWKRIPVLSNSRARGPRAQIRDGIDGRLIADPTNPVAIKLAIQEMLADPEQRERWGQNAQRHVHERFLVTGQLRKWGELLAGIFATRSA